MPMLQKWQLSRTLSFSVHLTKCIVTDPPPPATLTSARSTKTKLSLVVPTNPTLTSTSLFPYFKRGSDSFGWWRLHIPHGMKGQSHTQIGSHDGNNKTAHFDWEHSSKWGGMDAGNGMLYPVQTVDGLVYLHSGIEYHKHLESLREQINPGKTIKLNETTLYDNNVPYLVQTPAFGQLKTEVGFDYLLHVAPPVYRPDEKQIHEPALETCYFEAFNASLAADGMHIVESENTKNVNNIIQNETRVLYTPLIGSGCRNWPNDLAADVAVNAIHRFSRGERYLFSSKSCRAYKHICMVVVDEQVGEVILSAAKNTLS